MCNLVNNKNNAFNNTIRRLLNPKILRIFKCLKASKKSHVFDLIIFILMIFPIYKTINYKGIYKLKTDSKYTIFQSK